MKVYVFRDDEYNTILSFVHPIWSKNNERWFHEDHIQLGCEVSNILVDLGVSSKVEDTMTQDILVVIDLSGEEPAHEVWVGYNE